MSGESETAFFEWVDYDLVKANYCAIFLQKAEKFLFLYRNGKKANDPNLGKWLGVGGRIESQETPRQAVQREVCEETGYHLHDARFIGQVVYISASTEYDSDSFARKSADDNNAPQILSNAIFYSQEFSGTQIECPEGELHWLPPSDFHTLPRWIGDDVYMPFVFRGEAFGYLYFFYRDQEFVRCLGPRTEPLTSGELEKLYLAHVAV